MSPNYHQLRQRVTRLEGKLKVMTVHERRSQVTSIVNDIQRMKEAWPRGRDVLTWRQVTALMALERGWPFDPTKSPNILLMRLLMVEDRKAASTWAKTLDAHDRGKAPGTGIHRTAWPTPHQKRLRRWKAAQNQRGVSTTGTGSRDQ